MENQKISRRDFICKTAAGTAAFALMPSGLSANTAVYTRLQDAKKYAFYMIGHGHIDPVWLWSWTEGVSIVHSTFRSALDRIAETPGVVFTSSSAQFYQWVADSDPAMLEEIKQRIGEGRWNVVGGWWVEPDVNLPSGEALVRQGLYGQLTLQRLLGVRAKTAFNPDSFGHAGTLPQIFRLQGMDNYVFMRPGAIEKTIPSDLFWWESPDGSRVLTYRIQDGYELPREVSGRLDNMLKHAPSRKMTDFMLFYGIGDHGGGPTKENIRSINELKAEKGAPVIQYSTVDRYFDDIRAKNPNLPVLKDDLQYTAVGCYSAEVELKKNNRLSEVALVVAEKITAVGSVFWGVSYPKEKFTDAWKQVLFLQFHDSLAGTSLSAHSQDAREGYNYALHTAHTATALAIQKLEWQIPAEDPDSDYLIVFNPHAWEVKANVEYDNIINRANTWAIDLKNEPYVTDERGETLPSQFIRSQSVTGRDRVLFTATLPPMGYRQIRIRRRESNAASKVSATDNRMENEFYRIAISPDGQIGIFDKEAGREVFKGGATGCKGVIIDDPSDTWSHGIRDFTKNRTEGRYIYNTLGEIGAFGKAQLKVLENGPLRAAIRVQSVYGDSHMTIDWMLTAGSRDIEALVTLDWHEKLKMLKYYFPVDVDSPEATYEVPYGVIVRETNGVENPGQRWIDLTGQRGADAYGLTVFNDAKYGYSVQDSEVRLTVTRSAPYAHHAPGTLAELDPDGKCYWQDQGIQTFRMMLTPHKGSWLEINAPRIAEEFIAPPVVICQGIHRGTKNKSGSFMAIDVPNVIVSTVKLSEEHHDGIIRLVETWGKETAMTLNFPVVNSQWKGKIKAFEIKTLRVDARSGNIKEVNLLEE